MRRALTTLLLAVAVLDVSAQAWPSKPLHAIIPVGAGSSTDIVHRFVLEQVSVQLGQPIVQREMGLNAALAQKAGLKPE